MRLLSIELFGEYKGLRDQVFDLSSADGDVAVLIGMNGSGKSQVMELIAEVFAYLERKQRSDFRVRESLGYDFRVDYQLSSSLFQGSRRYVIDSRGGVRVEVYELVSNPTAVALDSHNLWQQVPDIDRLGDVLLPRLVGYDHLLAKDKYPLFGVHPGNLLPICHTCNSKAKSAKDLLYKDSHRRLSFSPWTECATTVEVDVTVDDADVVPQVVVNLHGGTDDRQEKLDTWNEVYQIKGRVEGEFRALHTKIAEDVSSLSEADFLGDLERLAIAKAGASRRSPFNYWRARVYRSVRAMDQASREALRLAIQQSAPSAHDMDNLFYN